MLNKILKRTVLAAGVASLVGFAGVASADPATFIPTGEFRAKFTNYESTVGNPTPDLFGLINITQITDASGTVNLWNGNGASDGTQLVGYFQNLIPKALDQSPAGTNLSFGGGQIVLYNVPNGTFSPSTTPNTKNFAAQLCGGACPAPWLTLDFVAGINDALVGVITANYPVAGTNPGDATLQSANATTSVNTGNGFLSVTGGTWASKFDTNGFNFTHFAPADMSLRSNFALQGNNCSPATAQGWQTCSDDPIDGFAIPEPGTVALVGLAALAAGAVRRKRTA